MLGVLFISGNSEDLTLTTDRANAGLKFGRTRKSRRTDFEVSPLQVCAQSNRHQTSRCHFMLSTTGQLLRLLVVIVPAFSIATTNRICTADQPNIVVFYTDDHGYSDLSCQGVFDDIRTPHVDALAASGVRALHGYSTAPQCVPSRAGLMIGKFQARFGVEANGKSLEGFDRETTIAQRLQAVGYVTAQFGKWHLGPAPEITKHGFNHVYAQNSQAPFSANVTMDGKDRPLSVLSPEAYHIDGCSQAAASLIQRYKDQPFFLYVAYRAPHVPLDAPPKYLTRFPGKMQERRRQALAMLSAVDDGVGLIAKTLKDNNLSEKTLIFYIGDNGAPLKIHKLDTPGGGPGWDGSLNDPLNGEKGMLTEGGMHVPFVVSWPGTISGGQEYPHPISALDVAATATEIAGIEIQPGDLDGVNLVPFLSGQNTSAPHDALMWRWVSQSAIRENNWKLLRGGDREYLYDLDVDLEEQHNLAAKHPEIADRLRKRLIDWADGLSPRGLAEDLANSGAWGSYFDFYLDGKKPAALSNKIQPQVEPVHSTVAAIPWVLRNGQLSKSAGGLQIISDRNEKNQFPFLARNGLKLTGPVVVRIVVKATGKGVIGISWRTAKEDAFTSENRINIAFDESSEWQTVEGSLASDSMIIHVRVQVPAGVTIIRDLELKPARGETATLLK
jgi:arylsulfatase A-like enzyme